MSYDQVELEPVIIPRRAAFALSGSALLEQAAAAVGPQLSPEDWEAYDHGLLPGWAVMLAERDVGTRISVDALFLALAGWRATRDRSYH